MERYLLIFEIHGKAHRLKDLDIDQLEAEYQKLGGSFNRSFALGMAHGQYHEFTTTIEIPYFPDVRIRGIAIRTEDA